MLPTSAPPATAQGRLLAAACILLSACLLFLVQPMAARSLLPRFGGTAAVWATCLFFFQFVLLLGYGYAHVSIRHLTPRGQATAHLLLLAISGMAAAFALPFLSAPADASRPVLSLLSRLAVTVGLPYLALSATSPLLQAWLARRGESLPYRLYALSNAGSVAALVLYPFAIEPVLPLSRQHAWWAIGFGAFALLCAAVAWQSRTTPAIAPGEASSVPWADRLVWAGLAAIPSLLLLVVSNHLAQNVAGVPFLWVLPLAAYLVSFILAFDRESWYRPHWFRWVVALMLAGMAAGQSQWAMDLSLRIQVPFYTVALFVCCWFCHAELALRKPGTHHLTAFYLLVAAGGAAGSLFVAAVAPLLLAGGQEYALAVAACAVVALACLFGLRSPRLLVRFGLVIVLAFFAAGRWRDHTMGVRWKARNFYGTLTVNDIEGGLPGLTIRTLVHGPIQHGVEILSASGQGQPISYYGPLSGVGRLLGQPHPAPRRVAVVGLGAGTVAAYGRFGDTYRFYEINPLVESAARTQFTFLNRCRARCEVLLGDGRLLLEREPAGSLDAIVVDAFSGDAIPLHLLTREAMSLYLDRLRPEGVVALHITNRYIDLAPAVRRVAESVNAHVRLIPGFSDSGRGWYFTLWVLVSRQPITNPALVNVSQPIPARPIVPVWTDDYSNILPLLR